MSYIVPREKPKCYNCPFRTLDYCGLLIEHDCVTVNVNKMTSSEYCPLVEIPTPHGVLKDTTAFDERIRDQYCKKCERRFGIKNGKRKEVYEIGGVPCRACDIGDMLDWLDDTATVIEAEGETDA